MSKAASGWWTCGVPRSIAASGCTCPSTRMRARSAAAISRERGASHGARHHPGDAHLPTGERTADDLSGGERAQAERRRDRLLPDRRALVAHLVRPDVPLRFQYGPQLRRLVDRVGQPGESARGEAVVDRETRIAWLVDHAQRPRFRGSLPDADARVPGGNPGG